MKILVTGASGNVGAEVVNELKNRDCDVRLALRNPDDVTAGRMQKVKFDFADPATYHTAFNNVQRVFLMRPPAISEVEKYIFPAIDAAATAGVRHVVFLSLQGAESNPLVPHHKIEEYLKKSSLHWTFLRPSFFMQNLSTTHRHEIKDHDEIFVPAGKGKTSFIDVRDIASVAALTLYEPGHLNKAYELTGTEPLSYHQVARIFSRVLGRKITYANPSIPRFAYRMFQRGENLKFIAVMIALYSTVRFGLAKETTSTLSELLKRPAISLEQYIEDYRDSWS